MRHSINTDNEEIIHESTAVPSHHHPHMNNIPSKSPNNILALESSLYKAKLLDEDLQAQVPSTIPTHIHNHTHYHHHHHHHHKNITDSDSSNNTSNSSTPPAGPGLLALATNPTNGSAVPAAVGTGSGPGPGLGSSGGGGGCPFLNNGFNGFSLKNFSGYNPHSQGQSQGPFASSTKNPFFEEVNGVPIIDEPPVVQDVFTKNDINVIFRLFPDALFIVDVNGIILNCSPPAAVLFGYRKDQLISQSINILLPTQYREKHDALIKGAFVENRVKEMGSRRTVHGLHQNGNKLELSIHLSPFRLILGEGTGSDYDNISDGLPLMLCVVRDITERSKLIMSRQRVANRSKLMEEFLRLVNHDTRTSLHAMNHSLTELHVEISQVFNELQEQNNLLRSNEALLEKQLQHDNSQVVQLAKTSGFPPDSISNNNPSHFSVFSPSSLPPMPLIGGESSLRRSTTIPRSLSARLGDVQSAAERMGLLLSNMLDLQNMQSGNMVQVTSSFNAGALLSSVAAYKQKQSLDSGVTVEVYAAQSIPALSGNAELLFKCIMALTDNAIKSSPQGSRIILRASIPSESDIQRMHSVNVRKRHSDIDSSESDSEDLEAENEKVLATRDAAVAAGVTGAETLVYTTPKIQSRRLQVKPTNNNSAINSVNTNPVIIPNPAPLPSPTNQNSQASNSSNLPRKRREDRRKKESNKSKAYVQFHVIDEGIGFCGLPLERLSLPKKNKGLISNSNSDRASSTGSINNGSVARDMNGNLIPQLSESDSDGDLPFHFFTLEDNNVSTTRGTSGGLGLGIPIARLAVRGLKGALEILSSPKEHVKLNQNGIFPNNSNADDSTLLNLTNNLKLNNRNSSCTCTPGQSDLCSYCLQPSRWTTWCRLIIQFETAEPHPLLNPDQQQQIVKDLLNEESARKRKDFKILVVEDNLVNSKILLTLLKKRGFTSVESAVNGKVALDMVEAKTAEFDRTGQTLAKLHQEYNLILMDCEMPVMDGFVCSATLRAKGYSIPIIALTANATADCQNKCIDSGMICFLTKPLKSEALFLTLAGIHPFNAYPLKLSPFYLQNFDETLQYS